MLNCLLRKKCYVIPDRKQFASIKKNLENSVFFCENSVKNECV